MSLSIGFDLVGSEEVAEAIRVHGRRYLDRVYTVEELGDSRGDPARLAARFAVKEATMKALRRDDEWLPWRSISVKRDVDGRPSVILNGAAAELARRRGVRSLSVSITYTGEMAGAVVLAEVRP